MKKLSVWCLSGWVFAAQLGCETKVCTARGCSDQLTIRFSSALLPGHYEFQTEAGKESQSCVFEIEEDGVVTSQSCALEISRNHISEYDAPERLTARLYFEGALVGELVDRKPKYDEYYPNGPECDTTSCRQGETTMDVNLSVGTGGEGGRG